MTAFWLLISLLVTNPPERRIIVIRSKWVLLMKARMPFFRLAERFLGNRLLILLGLEVPARQQRHQVLQLAASELRGEGHPQHVGVGRIVDVVIDVAHPLHLVEELGRRRTPGRPS